MFGSKGPSMNTSSLDMNVVNKVWSLPRNSLEAETSVAGDPKQDPDPESDPESDPELEPKLPSKSDPDPESDPKHIIPDPQPCFHQRLKK